MDKSWFRHLLRLVRIENLLIIALTLFLLRQFIIVPEFFNYKNFLPHSLNGFQFGLLILATVFIAAAGYIVNDYFDVNVDSINRPAKVLVGRVFGKQEAFRIHLFLNIAGSLLGLYVGWQAGSFRLGFIFLLTAGLLWFYAKSFKKQLLIGNLIVAFLTALVVFLPYIFETGLFKKSEIARAVTEALLPSFIAYSFFAFLTTLIREIIKDLQDIKGDQEYGSRTLPIVAGVNFAKATVAVLSLVLIGSLGYVQKLFFEQDEFMKIAYILVAIQLPAVAIVLNLIAAQSAEDFGKVSRLVKIIILLGVLSIVLFSFL